ncbi:hypothetical protein ACFQ15_05585 [Sphingomonas hankookensis]|uniref:hypothetical protein n=1 Tax=Sphingomonas hankookensis TaxID=563996 RepID=UPI001F5913CA|nr:hypothetical protein [Sphingomonas hankookensis]
MMALDDECRAAGLDPVEVDRIARRIARAARDAQRLGLTVFGGSGHGSLRLCGNTDDRGRPLIVAGIDAGSWDGGDGGYGPANDGLNRGEGI